MEPTSDPDIAPDNPEGPIIDPGAPGQAEPYDPAEPDREES